MKISKHHFLEAKILTVGCCSAYIDLLIFQDIPDFLIWGTCSRNLNRNLLKAGDRHRKVEGG